MIVSWLVALAAVYLLLNIALLRRINLLANARLPYILGSQTRDGFLRW